MLQCSGPRRPWQGRHWKFSMSMPSLDLGITQAGFKSKLQHGIAEWPWQVAWFLYASVSSSIKQGL